VLIPLSTGITHVYYPLSTKKRCRFWKREYINNLFFLIFEVFKMIKERYNCYMAFCLVIAHSTPLKCGILQEASFR
jgi:hypothetical protein